MRLRWLLLCTAVACSGTEGDLLSRLPADLGAADGASGFACQTLSQSGTCIAETTWEAIADKACVMAGLSLQSYLLAQPCSSGEQRISFVCCPQAIVKGCVQETQGSAAAPLCQGAGVWKMTAAAACQVGMFTLQSLTLLYPSGCSAGDFGGATYVCCP